MKYKTWIYYPFQAGLIGYKVHIPHVDPHWEESETFIIEKFIECVEEHPTHGWIVTLSSGTKHILQTKPKIKGLK
jgi:hypothetical protein